MESSMLNNKNQQSKATFTLNSPKHNRVTPAGHPEGTELHGNFRVIQ
jgi:hypothetical protein